MFNREGNIKLLINVQECEKDGIWISVVEGLEQIRMGSILTSKARNSPTGECDWLKKNKLPCVIWNYSGNYAYFDFDFKEYEAQGGIELVQEKVKYVKDVLINTSYVSAVWESVSAKGLGLLVKHEFSLKSNIEWEQFYDVVYAELQHITGEKPDHKCVNFNRKNVLSCDPDIYINLNADSFSDFDLSSSSRRVHSDNKTEESKTHVATKCTPPTQIKGRFFAQSYIDVHFKQYLDEAILVNEEKGYAIFPTRMTKIGIYKPKNKIFGEGRKSMLFYALITRYFLNPSYRQDSLYGWFRAYNNEMCDPPLSDTVLQGTFDYVMQRITAKDFFIKGNRDCYVHFFSDCMLTLKEKKSIVGKSRVIRSKQSIKMAIQELLIDQKEITKSKVSELAGVKVRTVTKYWSEFLPDEMRKKIEEHKHNYYNYHPLPDSPPSWLSETLPGFDEIADFGSPDIEYEPEPVYPEEMVDAIDTVLSLENAA
jgi:hypothetical protein